MMQELILTLCVEVSDEAVLRLEKIMDEVLSPGKLPDRSVKEKKSAANLTEPEME